MANQNEKQVVEVTKDIMESFISLRDSGIMNMVSPQVRDYLGINKSQHYHISEHFEELLEQFGIEDD